MTARLVVLASGSGTNCQAIIEACNSRRVDADVVAVVTNNVGAGVVQRAEAAGVAVAVVTHTGTSTEERSACDRTLMDVVDGYSPDLVVLAGWMRILGSAFGSRFSTINLHPAKPGQFPGLHAIERAYEAWLGGEITETGMMSHWVPDAGVDTGPVIVEAAIEFRPDESLSEFEQRFHTAEHQLIVEGIRAALVSAS